MAKNLQVDNNLSATEQYVKDQDGNTSSLAIGTDGKVGIGTTTPGAKLTVLENAADYVAHFRNSNASGSGVKIEGGNGSNYILKGEDYSGNERFRVNGDGNVGIGTTNPVSKLHANYGSLNASAVNPAVPLTLVHNESTVPSTSQQVYGGIIIGRDKASGLSEGDALGGINFGGHSYNGTDTEVRAGFAAIGALVGGSNGQGRLTFHTANSALVPAERMRIDEGGNVGIGTTSPIGKLHVDACGTVHLTDSSAPALINLGEATSGNNRVLVGWVDTGNYATIDTAGGVAPLSLQPTGGKVGIGTASPSAPLHVNGQVRIVHGYPSYGKVLTCDDSNGNASWQGVGCVYPDDPRTTGYITKWSSSAQITNSIIYETSGKIGIGTTTGIDEVLVVDGKVKAEDVLLENIGADYVFDKCYRLRSLAEVQEFVSKNRHLPDVPDTDEFENSKLGLARINQILFQKIEELTLYLLQHEKKIDEQNNKIRSLEISLAKAIS